MPNSGAQAMVIGWKKPPNGVTKINWDALIDKAGGGGGENECGSSSTGSPWRGSRSVVHYKTFYH